MANKKSLFMSVIVVIISLVAGPLLVSLHTLNVFEYKNFDSAAHGLVQEESLAQSSQEFPENGTSIALCNNVSLSLNLKE